jgi:predicted acyltransferase
MKRVVSIDLFRGITIALMIFVNDVASVPDAPKWLHHVRANTDGMTLPDLVFPAFLFIVGMVIPIALEKRLSRGILPSLKHIGERSLALIIMGVMMLNSGAYNPHIACLPKALWQLLMYTSFFLIWNIWEDIPKLKRYMPKIGWMLLIFLSVIYRRGDISDIQWLRTGWWGILGLIGWAYAAASLIYLFFKNREEIIILSMGFCILLFIGEVSGRLDALQPLVDFIHPGKFLGTHTLIVLAGLYAGLQLKKGRNVVLKRLPAEALALWLAGWLLHNVYIVSKIQATPVWGLWSAALCVLIFLLIYFIVDIKGLKTWGNPFQPSAQNPLTAYLLPAVFYILFDILSIPYFQWGHIHAGAGMFRAFLFTAFILMITHVCTRFKIKIKL